MPTASPPAQKINSIGVHVPDSFTRTQIHLRMGATSICVSQPLTLKTAYQCKAKLQRTSGPKQPRNHVVS